MAYVAKIQKHQIVSSSFNGLVHLNFSKTKEDVIQSFANWCQKTLGKRAEKTIKDDNGVFAPFQRCSRVLCLLCSSTHAGS
jgi:hypothetical protein